MATPTLPQTQAELDALLAWLKEKLDEVNAKLPEGTQLDLTDLKNIIDQGVGRFSAQLLASIGADLLSAIQTGEGPNEPPDIGLS